MPPACFAHGLAQQNCFAWQVQVYNTTGLCGKMADYFDARKGELAELRTLLQHALTTRDAVVLKDIVKRVISYMTQGLDVSRLFPEMVMVHLSHSFLLCIVTYDANRR